MSLDITNGRREVLHLLNRDGGGDGAVAGVVLVQDTQYPVVHQLYVPDPVHKFLYTNPARDSIFGSLVKYSEEMIGEIEGVETVLLS